MFETFTLVNSVIKAQLKTTFSVRKTLEVSKSVGKKCMVILFILIEALLFFESYYSLLSYN